VLLEGVLKSPMELGKQVRKGERVSGPVHVLLEDAEGLFIGHAGDVADVGDVLVHERAYSDFPIRVKAGGVGVESGVGWKVDASGKLESSPGSLQVR
jgi:hypothetical protein